MNLPLEIVQEIKTMSQQPKLNVVLYTFNREDDDTIDIQLHSHIYRMNNTIEIKKYNGKTLSQPIPVLSQKALIALLTQFDGCFFEDTIGTEMIIFTGEHDIVNCESYQTPVVISNDTPTYKLYNNPFCEYRMLDVNDEYNDYNQMFTEYAEKIWNILH